ncbi:hypothetical protein P43SY_011434 [Pythium insidiosum]|uniref:OTU domain-containing protein n=1 Tax=Pythium insidiosum TaxID=114742 RepID=A0AAD5L820_PYTIN|nr:hypothetical protein P43SY_011434 [Pythium insidiosum]
MYRLYVRLPRGFMLPQYNANRQFWNLLQKGAESTGGTNAKNLVERLFEEHYTTTCEAKFQLVTLTFTSPEVRNRWKNRQLPFISHKVKILLQASDTLSAQNPATGFDDGARNLQYSVLLLGLQSKTQKDVREIARAACGTQPSLIEELSPTPAPGMEHRQEPKTDNTPTTNPAQPRQDARPPTIDTTRDVSAPTGPSNSDGTPVETQDVLMEETEPVKGESNQQQQVETAPSSVTEFFPPADDKSATIATDLTPHRAAEAGDWDSTQFSSQELDELLADPGALPGRIDSLADWLRLFDARIVDNNADGRCLYQAVDGALRRTLRDNKLGNGNFSIKEAHTLKQVACTYLLHYLPQMLDDGAVHLGDLHTRYYGFRDDDITDAVKYVEVVAHIWEIYGYQAGGAIPVEHWSGAEELFGLVWYLREPIFVIGADAHVQVYLVEQAGAESHYDECMVILTPTDDRAWAMIQTILNHGAIPRVIVHGAGHFRTFRFAEAINKSYHDRTTRAGRDTMRDNLNTALMKLGLYAACARAPLPLAVPEDAIKTPSQLSGSLYAPSSDEGELSQEDEAALTTTDHLQLLDQLNPHQRLRSDERNLWRAAELANAKAVQNPQLPGL